jgi:hypothetical protein
MASGTKAEAWVAIEGVLDCSCSKAFTAKCDPKLVTYWEEEAVLKPSLWQAEAYLLRLLAHMPMATTIIKGMTTAIISW